MLTFAGIRFKNPFVVASSPLTRNLEMLQKCEQFGAAAVSTKLTFIQQPFYGKLRMYNDPKVGSIVCHDKRLDMDEGLRLVEGAKRQTTLVVFCNITHVADDLAGWARLAKAHEDAGADIIELNLICPNISLTARRLGQEITASGALIAQDPQMAGRVVRTVKQAVHIPVVAKLTPNVTDVSEIALACQQAGADGITLAGAQMSLPPPDIYHPEKPYPLLEGAAFGSLGGPACRLMGYAQVASTAQRLHVPIVGGGGIETWRHCVEYMMWGATLVTACTSLMWYGFERIPKILQGIERFMAAQGYNSYDELVGRSLASLRPARDLVAEPGSAYVDVELCNGCKRCLGPGHCTAITMVDDKAVVEPDLCLGCSICVALCPTNAITMSLTTVA
jgi:dihydropyrimidine dehydrogenase (NAD+) subunit PreA